MSDNPARGVSRIRSLVDMTQPQMEKDHQIVALKEYTEQQQLSDPFKNDYGDISAGVGGVHILQPTYSFYSLMRMPLENSTLRQCIDAMVTNVDGHGHRLMYIGPEGAENSKPAQAEATALKSLLDYPNDEYGFQELRERVRRDYETLGFAYIEVGRDRRNRIVMLSHVPAHTMRKTTRDHDTVDVEVTLPREGKRTAKIKKRFRRYVQQIGTRKVYFKEFGDPRRVDPQTGNIDDRMPLKSSATEILEISQYTPGSAYGLPRWFHQMPAILGSRQAELTNLDYFKENAVPAGIVFVSGGLLTDESVQALENHFRNARGRQAQNRIAVIEAGVDASLAADNGAMPVPRIEFKTLHGERQGDALFQDYEKNAATKVRTAFRLPPLYLGESTDYTYATAKTSFEVAEGQVFGPERHRFDTIMNSMILSTYNPAYWAFRTQGPRLAARDDMTKALAVFERVGALTPNVTIGLANEFFDLEIKPVNEPWGDYPFSLVSTMVQTGMLKGEMFVGMAGDIADTKPVPAALNPGGEEDDTDEVEDGEVEVEVEEEAARSIQTALAALGILPEKTSG
jgi:PBSX family phage portal protein